MKRAALLFVALAMTGCLSQIKSKLGELPEVDSSSVTIVDLRSPWQKEPFRPEGWKPVQVLGDDNFEPKIVDYFRTKLAQEAVTSGRRFAVEILELRIVDYYAHRLGAAQEAGLAGAGVYVSGLLSMEKDFVLFEFKGRVNGRDVDLKSGCPYSVSPFTGIVYNDDSFKKAVDTTVSEVVSKVVDLIE